MAGPGKEQGRFDYQLRAPGHPARSTKERRLLDMEKQDFKKQLLFLEPSMRLEETKEELVERLIAVMERVGIKVNRHGEKDDETPN